MSKVFRHLNRREAVLGLGAAVGLAATAWGQAPYPNRPIRLVVPFAAARGADIVCRAMTQHLAGVLGPAAVVDNRSGGAGTIGTVEIARATPTDTPSAAATWAPWRSTARSCPRWADVVRRSGVKMD